LIAEKEVVIEYCPTEEQIADIFTKPLNQENAWDDASLI